MSKQIVTRQHGQVHCHAGCSECNFSVGILTDDTPKAKDVRNAVRRHVRNTGHECWIETGTHTVYTLEVSP